MQSENGRPRGGLSLVWPFVAACAGLVPFAGAFSARNAFYTRDLGMDFWPRHLWQKHAIPAGDWPLWDPYAGAGQPAVADALNQLFFPATLIRLALPDVVGFNVWVAAPFPLMAVGCWLWLRRYVSHPAAAVGAALFALAGPVLSTGTFPNLSWSVACIPWILWAADRVIERRGIRPIAVLASCAALQALAGEPVTLAGTGVLATAYAWAGATDRGWRERVAPTSRVVAALATGALLASVQLLPLLWTAMRSARTAGVDAQLWSLHPLQVVDAVIPHMFGHPDDGLPATMPWLSGMYGREPLLASLYIGLGGLLLALIRSDGGRTRPGRAFWWGVAAMALIAALGDHTPVYPALRAIVPLLQSFRYSIKYSVFCVLALSVLAAHGADALVAHARARQSMRRPASAAVVLGIVVAVSAALALLAVVHPDGVVWLWRGVAPLAAVEDPGEAAEWMLGRWPLLLGTAVLAIGLAMVLAVIWTRHRWAPAAAAAFCAIAIASPALVNRDLYPTMPAGGLGPPDWVAATRAHSMDRVYVGGRVQWRVGPLPRQRERLDAPEQFHGDAELPVQQANTLVGVQLLHYPAAWGVRDSILYDLPGLSSRDYARMIDVFRRAPRDARFRFLQRTGVRYCYVDEAPERGLRPLVPANAMMAPMALYDCNPHPRRVYVTAQADVEPDVAVQIERMFDEAHDPYSAVLLDADAPAAAGQSGAGVTPAASIVRETNTELVVAASVPRSGGYLTVMDSYDPHWRVDVDGSDAELLRANGLFRAVRLTPGRHVVRFSYRPIPLYAGFALTSLTALALIAASLWERRSAR